MQKEKVNKKLIWQILLLALIFFGAIFVWYSPVLFKGYPLKYPDYRQIAAKSIIENGKFSLESEKNVILSSEKVPKLGVISSQGDRLIPILSAGIYKLAGLPSPNQSVMIGVAVYAFSLLFFFLVTWRLFGYFQALLFSVIYIFLPIIWDISLWSNYYEYSLLFFSVALLFLFARKQKNSLPLNIAAGAFFALSFLSRDAMLLFGPVLFIWLWLYRRKAILPLFGAMLIVLVSVPLIFGLLFGSAGNNHMSYFGVNDDNAQGKDFYFYGHLYPDPYTYHYEKEEYLTGLKKELSKGGLTEHNIAKRMSNVESERISLWHRLKVAPVLLVKHLATIVSLESIGGSMIFLFFLLGLWDLKQRKNNFFQLSIIWISFVFFACSFVVLVQRNHVMDFAFAFALLVSLGITFFSKLIFIKTKPSKFINSKTLSLLLVFLVVYQLIMSSHVLFGRTYDSSGPMKINYYANQINHINLSSDDVIATPLGAGIIYSLNYLTDKSIVKFDKETIEKLYNEEKIQDVFDDFEVTHIVGFSVEQTEKIVNVSNVNVISENDVTLESFEVSPLKSLFMNLVK